MAGKGDRYRPVDRAKWDAAWEGLGKASPDRISFKPEPKPSPSVTSPKYKLPANWETMTQEEKDTWHYEEFHGDPH